MKNKYQYVSNVISVSILTIYAMTLSVIAFMRVFEVNLNLNITQFKGTIFFSLMLAGFLCSMLIGFSFFIRMILVPNPIKNFFIGLFTISIPMLFINLDVYNLLFSEHANIKFIGVFLCASVIINEFLNKSSLPSFRAVICVN